MDTQNLINIISPQRIVLFSLPFQGHINPMFQLGNILHSKGFTISIIHTHYNSPDPSKYPHFTFHQIPDGLSEVEDPMSVITLINVNCVEPIRNCLKKLLLSEQGAVKCLITDANCYFAQSVADSLKLPRIVLRTSSICSFLALAAFPFFRENGCFSNRDSKLLEEAIQELPPLEVKDVPAMEMFNVAETYQNIIKMVEQTKKASALIFNTFQELEEAELAKLNHQFPLPTFALGPFHKCFSAASSSLFTQDTSSISWLDKQKPKSVLYVCFGSIVAMDDQKIQEVAYGLANSNQPFLWAFRPGLVQGSEWLDGLPKGFLESTSKRGYIVKWAPQQEVLSHQAIGGFWTHNGWNSTLESICEGVPMICSPFFADQNVNSWYVSDIWKLGIMLEKGLERGDIERAIRRLIVEKEGDEIRQRVVFLKERIDLGLKLGGSCSQSLDSFVNFISSL